MSTIGFGRQGTTLIVDLNKNGMIDLANDLAVLNFFAVADEEKCDAGSGFIETIYSFTGEQVRKLFCCPDPKPLRIELMGGVFEDTDGDGDCDGEGTILIGRTDGIATMLRIENAKAEYDGKSFRLLRGIVYSEIGNVTAPLFQGSFIIERGKTETSFVLDSGNAANEFRLAGLDISFKKFDIRPNEIALAPRFVLPEEIGGIEIDSVSPISLDALFIRQNGISLGVGGKINIKPPKEFPFFKNLFTIKDAEFSLEYKPIESELEIKGSFKLETFIKATALEEFSADFSGDDNFVKIKNGIPEFKGSISLKQDPVENPAARRGGWGFTNFILTIDTTKNKVGASGGITFPFKGRLPEIDLGADFIYNPFALDGIKIGVDNLNIPFVFYPKVFIQKFAGGATNFAPRKEKIPILYSGGLGLTLGPQVVGVALLRVDLGLTTDFENKFTGTGKFKVIDDKIFKGEGSLTLDWQKGFFETKSSYSILDDAIRAKGSFKITSSYNINLFSEASFNIPKSIPIIGGKSVANGNFLLDFTNDNYLPNDFAAAWTTLAIPVYFTEIEFVIGFKGYFDGRFERIGARNIPKTGSFAVESETEWILLNADWENPANPAQVQVRIIAPDGTIFTEDEFASTGRIAVVNQFTDSGQKVVIVLNPEAGIWDIEVVDSIGLGTIQYNAERDAGAVPTIEITAPTIDIVDEAVTIGYNAFDPDSNAKVSLFYDNDNQGFDGILITDGLDETDGSSSYVWNLEGLSTGTYFVYAMVMDDNNIPALSNYATGRVQVTKEADLSVTKTANAESVDVGNQLTYTIAVTNNGLDISKGVILTETLPEDATFVSATLTPTSQSGNILEFNLGDLANSQKSTLDITFVVPTILGRMTGSALVSSKTYDPDKTNNLVLLDNTVTNAQSLPEIVIDDVSLDEGDSGTTDFIFTVSLSQASAEIVKVNYTTVDDTATSNEQAPSDKDYTAISGTLEFAPGETQKTIALTVIGDTVLEPNETFFVNLRGTTGAAILDAQGLGTIKDKLSLSIDDVTLPEGDSSSTNAVFTVRLSDQSTETVRVDYATVDETTKAGEDYLGASGTLEFAPGETEKTITVEILGDTAVETDESFLVQLSNATGAELLNPQGKGTIENNEIVGTDSNDILSGTNGDDNIQGFGGDDLLIGNEGNDIIIGGAGTDTLTAGNGNDTLTGGVGSDRFVFNSITESIDTITDWEAGGGDQIEISASGFGDDLIANAFLEESRFVLGSTALDNNHRFIYNGSTGDLFFDPDGMGSLAQQQIATLTGAPSLNANDIFVLV